MIACIVKMDVLGRGHVIGAGTWNGDCYLRWFKCGGPVDRRDLWVACPAGIYGAIFVLWWDKLGRLRHGRLYGDRLGVWLVRGVLRRKRCPE